MHQSLIDSLIKASGEIDLAIWSETVIPYINNSFNADLDYSLLQDHASTYDYDLISGFAEFYFYKEGDYIPDIAKEVQGNPRKKYDTHNAVLYLDNDKPNISSERPKTYRKMKLTPFAEHFPHAETLWFMRDLVKWGVGISGWKKGDTQFNMQIKDSLKLGTIICIESIYPDFVAGFTDKGAGFLTIITNDAWYDFTPGPEQHFQIARMRAIENRRYIPRVANTGVTGLIGADGSEIDRIEQYKAGAAAYDIPLLATKSVFVTTRWWFGSIITAVAFVFLFITVGKKIQQYKSNREML
ncbi:MAG: hypothetical protein Kapaf2KO_22210 [Candidatus Kapaibacteriales bacterium]